MEKIIKIVVNLTAIACIYIIMYVGAGLQWLPHFHSDSREITGRANAILLNISYSYLAGFIFYLLTISLPHWEKKRRIRPVIIELCKQVRGKFEDSIKALWPMADWNNVVIDKENVVNRLHEVSVNDLCGYSSAGINRSIISHITMQKKNIDDIVDNLLGYKEFMSTKFLLALEEIKESNLLYLASAFHQFPIMDRPDNRQKLADELWKLYEKSGELQKY